MGLDLFLGLEVSLGGLLVFYEITLARGAPFVVTWAAAGLVTNSNATPPIYRNICSVSFL